MEWKLETVQAYLGLSGQDEEDAHLLADYSKDNMHIETDPAKVPPDIDLWIKSLQLVDVGYEAVHKLIPDGRRPPQDVYEQWKKSEKAGDKQNRSQPTLRKGARITTMQVPAARRNRKNQVAIIESRQWRTKRSRKPQAHTSRLSWNRNSSSAQSQRNGKLPLSITIWH